MDDKILNKIIEDVNKIDLGNTYNEVYERLEEYVCDNPDEFDVGDHTDWYEYGHIDYYDDDDVEKAVEGLIEDLHINYDIKDKYVSMIGEVLETPYYKMIFEDETFKLDKNTLNEVVDLIVEDFKDFYNGEFDKSKIKDYIRDRYAGDFYTDENHSSIFSDSFEVFTNDFIEVVLNNVEE